MTGPVHPKLPELGGTDLIAFNRDGGPLVVRRSAVAAIGGAVHSQFGQTEVWIGSNCVYVEDDFTAALKTWQPVLFALQSEGEDAAVLP